MKIIMLLIFLKKKITIKKEVEEVKEEVMNLKN
jgi:hypothetical protein